MSDANLSLRNVTRIEVGELFRSHDKTNSYRVIVIKSENDKLIEITVHSTEYSIPVIVGEE